MPIPPTQHIPYNSIDTYDVGQSSASHSSITRNIPVISTHTTTIISPTVPISAYTTTQPVEVSLAPTPSTPPSNIIDKVIQHDNVNTNDYEDLYDKFDVVKLTNEALGQLNITPIDIDESYFEETFVADGT
ncbi:hypothetical protein KI387_030672, partial [Taxus chinensis]